ncbi:hypothetical protein [Chitinimonas koreensis]|uniref:hypothetical protein n=1 Tax=Chitinimonas koreensis TaxID=356302 RepID=UPI000400C5CB|nr:hypothetical protein [Chitinimonas koreensis]QNM94881.1 hypothetical protein H9L41_13210 [Chitinimonas koreensis]
MQYFSTQRCAEVEIDLNTASLEALNDAYTSLLEMSDSRGAYPGSKAWLKAKPHADKLAELIAARPEVEAYRKQVAAEKRAARLEGRDIYGM